MTGPDRLARLTALHCALAPAWVAATAGYAAVAAAGIVLGILFVPEPRLGQVPVAPLIGLAGLQAAIAAWLAQRPRVNRLSARMVVAGSFGVAVVLGRWFVSIWPNSGDEYGYIYLAETLLQGRLWNAPPPVADLFDTYWIYEKNGIRLSQYAPGWSAALVPFVATGAAFLASPLALLATGALLVASLRRLGAAAPEVVTLAALVLLAPFSLFNGASLFPMTFAAALVLAIIWLQLRDEAAPSLANRVLVGLCFSAILAVRYEIFLTVLPLYVCDQAIRRGRRFLRDVPGYVVGAAPLTLLFLGYNWSITGHPLHTTIAWLRPGLELGMAPLDEDGPLTLRRVVWNQQIWFALLCAFGGLPLSALYAAALVRKLRAVQVRFHDFVPLSAVAFFLLFPDIGGHQFGPRYWFYGFAPMALTAAALATERDGWMRLARWQLHGPTFATVCAVGFLATTAVVAPLFRTYANVRHEVYDTLPGTRPAVVLVPSRQITIVPWQQRPYSADSKDFTRNGTDFSGDVLYARADAPHAIERACQLPGRAVYVWEDGGTLRPVACGHPGPDPGR